MLEPPGGSFPQVQELKTMRQVQWLSAFVLMAPVAAFAFLVGCGGGGGGTTSTPPPTLAKIQNINSSTTATSPVNLPIEINGSGFQAAPGKVTFTQGSVSMDVTPAATAWTDTGIVATLPDGNGATNFTVPGTVSVTVTTSNGTSNAVAVTLAPTLNFTPSQMAWGTTVSLPIVLAGLRAVAVPGTTNTSAFAVVTGGFDGQVNSISAFSIPLNQDGTVGTPTDPLWTSISTTPLPTGIAFHAMAEADDTNSLVPVGQRYIYVIGGQPNSSAQVGSNLVYMAGVNSTSGVVGTWTSLSATLPQALYGLTATVHNGYLYVAGGVNNNGAPVNAVYSAPIASGGTLGAWTTATNPLPKATAFGNIFVYGGVIYYLDGDVNTGVLPNDQDIGDTNVYYAGAVRGVVGSWTENGNPTSQGRAKGVLLTAFGQVISGEGVYAGFIGSSEMEVSSINSSNTANDALNAFTHLTAVPGANVYNAAAITSPLISTTKAPRFLILGGEALTGASGTGGALSSTVYYNSKP
jgi:hypothetical protein